MKRVLSFTGCLMAFLVIFMAGCADKNGGPTPPPSSPSPTVTSTSPAPSEPGVPINRSILATFSKAMAPGTITTTTYTLTGPGGTVVPGTVNSIGSIATFKPSSNLAKNTTYTSTITTGVTDLAGNALAANYVWSWTTGATTDSAAPTVTITNPVNLDTNVPLSQTVNATFSKDMNPVTMTTTNFTVVETVSSNPVPGKVAYDVITKVATFSPQNSLKTGTQYTATVTNATDLASNALVAGAVPNPWTFTTTATAPTQPALAINLRNAATFGIAAQEGLTSTGVTVVNGDIALYPLAKCVDSTGNFGASQPCLVKTYASNGGTGMAVKGSIYWAGDPFDNGGTAHSVANDLNIAWVEGKNKVDTKGAIAADELGGGTFTPGVYHNATLGLKAGGTATMDALNDGNAVFIFKVDSSFVDSGTLLLPSQIKLINGAQARNVWFVSGLDITIGSGTKWFGNILAGRTATVLDGSTVIGRVLAGASGAGSFSLIGAASPSVTTITVPQ